MHNHWAVMCAIAVISLAGCESLHVDHISLKHTQQQTAAAVAGADSVVVSVKANDSRNVLAPGISRKLGQAVVGYGRNGLGEQTYPDIIVTEPVALTLKRSIEDELKARGFHVDGIADFIVEVDIRNFFNDYKVGLIFSESVADLNMDIKVLSSKGALLYSRNIAVQGRKAWASTMRGDDAEIALNRALDNGINALFGDNAFLSVFSPDR